MNEHMPFLMGLYIDQRDLYIIGGIPPKDNRSDNRSPKYEIVCWHATQLLPVRYRASNTNVVTITKKTE